MMYDYGYGFGWYGIFMMLLFWGFIIGGILLLVKWFRTEADRGTAHGESALDILNKRYAAGEIEKKEYEDKKKAILASGKDG